MDVPLNDTDIAVNFFLVCNVGHWGMGCLQDCQCNGRGTCNPFNGQCDCNAGYKGSSCETRTFRHYWVFVLSVYISYLFHDYFIASWAFYNALFYNLQS